MQRFCYALIVDHLGGNTICIAVHLHLKGLADKGVAFHARELAFFVGRLARVAWPAACRSSRLKLQELKYLPPGQVPKPTTFSTKA
jgi:hypothetical protein